MNKLDMILQRIKDIQGTLQITKNDEKEIDAVFENWIINRLNKKLKEKGWLENEK
jgi:conjugal transfer/entry exclusion protein